MLGRDLDQALSLTAEAETLAKLFLSACAAGKPQILDDEEMGRVIEKFRDYGYGPLSD